MQTATNHSYEEVKIIAFLSQEELNQWDWLRWLPHAQDNGRQQRYLAADQKSITQLCMEFEEILNARLSPVKKAGGSTQAHLLFLVGDTDLIARQTLMSILLTADPALHSTVIFTSRSKGQLPSGCTAIIETDGGEECWYPTQDSSDTHTYRADTWQLDSCARLARRMAAVRLAEGAAARELPRSVTFLEGYGVHRVEELHIENRWKKEGVEKTLAVPVAVRENGETFRFDIHETAHGPHGMVSGTSGSGKSEMVQSWILAMALQYPPDLVAFVIVDFKGDGLLAPFRKLPHLAGTISNLDHNAQRNSVALSAEIKRRQELLKQTCENGENNVTNYIAKYQRGEVTEPMPHLILVVDEFAEVKTLHPEFVPIVDEIYRVGRSLGIHIVTLAQDMASACTDTIEKNSKFRWCLQVTTPDSSREMLGTADAFTMPQNPGRGYVKVGDFEVYEKVQSFWSSAPYDPDHHSEQDTQPQISKVELGGERTALTGQVKQNNKAARETEISAVIRYICDYAERNGIPRPRQLWQAAIGRELVLEDIEPEDDGGARYVFTVGLVDNPAEQAQYPLSFQLEQCGSVALNGGPETGKTTFLITAILSLARRYSPDELELYLFDYDKDALNLFRNLPHTKGCTAGAGPEEIRAIVGAVQREIDRRKKLFLDAGVFSMEAYAARVRALPAVVMVVDNICNAWDDNSQMQDLLYAVAQKGAGYGIWMVVTAPGASFPFKIQNLFKTRLSLCQNDRGSFTDIVGRVEIMPENYPGRGLVRRGTALEFQTALPVPGNSAERELVLSEEVQDMREEWKNYAASRQQTEMAELRDSLVGNLFLGVTKDDQQPVLFENSGKHFMLVSCDSADVRRSLIANYAAQCTKMDAELVLFDDPDGTLADVSASHCFKHADPAGDTYIAELMEVLNERQEQREVDPNVELPRLILLIAEIRSFFGAAEDDTIRDLRDIVELGSGLGITLLVAGSRMGLRELSGDRLGVAMLREGHVLFVGGALKEHAAQDTVRSMAWTEQERKLDDSEAWYVLDDTVRLLQIRSEGMKKYNE